MAVRETIATFLARASDVILAGRSAARIVLGTDRKAERNSGFGDESDDATEGAASIDLVAGFVTGNVDYVQDRSRVLIAQKTNPDEYFEFDLGEAQEETGAIVLQSDQIYLKARQNIKIRNGEITILLTSDGNIEIEASADTKVKSGNSVINMTSGGDISIGAESGQSRRILTEQDLAVGICPVTSAPIISKFVDAPSVNAVQGGLVNNNKVKVVI